MSSSEVRVENFPWRSLLSFCYYVNISNAGSFALSVCLLITASRVAAASWPPPCRSVRTNCVLNPWIPIFLIWIGKCFWSSIVSHHVHQFSPFLLISVLSRLSTRHSNIIKLTGKISSSNVLPTLWTKQLSASIHSSSYTRRLSYFTCKPGSLCYVLDSSGIRMYKTLYWKTSLMHAVHRWGFTLWDMPLLVVGMV